MTIDVLTLGSLPLLLGRARDGSLSVDAAMEGMRTDTDGDDYVADARTIASVDTGPPTATDARAAVPPVAGADARFSLELEDEPPFWP